MLVEDHQCTLPLQVSHEARYTVLRRQLYAKMYMIWHHRSSSNPDMLVIAQCLDDSDHIGSHHSPHFLPAILCDENNMVLAPPFGVC